MAWEGLRYDGVRRVLSSERSWVVAEAIGGKEGENTEGGRTAGRSCAGGIR